MRSVIILAIAVVAGIWIYRRLQKPKAQTPISQGLYFSASDLDPLTGAQLNPGAQPGTVNFSAQGN
jgi:hypothetical protein